MGFGLIFLGWSTLLFLKTLPPANIIGCLLMMKGLGKLEAYGTSFTKAKNACAVLMSYFVLYNIAWLLDMFKIFKVFELPNSMIIDSVIYYACLFTFAILLYKALGDISRQVGFEKGIRREKSSISFVIVFLVFVVVQVVLSYINTEYAAYLKLTLFIFELLWLIYSGVYIYSCYMMIATQEIMDEEDRKMREYDEKYSFRTPKNRKK